MYLSQNHYKKLETLSKVIRKVRTVPYMSFESRIPNRDRKLALKSCASRRSQNAYAHAASFCPLPAVDKENGKDGNNPFAPADATNYEDCIRECAMRTKNFQVPCTLTHIGAASDTVPLLHWYIPVTV